MPIEKKKLSLYNSTFIYNIPEIKSIIDGYKKEFELVGVGFVSGIKCKKCNHILPRHTVEDHFDVNNIIHKCPHRSHRPPHKFSIY